MPHSKIYSASLCWVPGHIGVAGNENACTSAKSATTDVDRLLPSGAMLHIDMTKRIKATIRKDWQWYWLSTAHQRKNQREIKPEI